MNLTFFFQGQGDKKPHDKSANDIFIQQRSGLGLSLSFAWYPQINSPTTSIKYSVKTQCQPNVDE